MKDFDVIEECLKQVEKAEMEEKIDRIFVEEDEEEEFEIDAEDEELMNILKNL